MKTAYFTESSFAPTRETMIDVVVDEDGDADDDYDFEFDDDDELPLDGPDGKEVEAIFGASGGP